MNFLKEANSKRQQVLIRICLKVTIEPKKKKKKKLISAPFFFSLNTKYFNTHMKKMREGYDL